MTIQRFTLEFQAEYARVPPQTQELANPSCSTVNRGAELVVQDTASYQKLLELAEQESNGWMPSVPHSQT